jgi:hypothetical protein
MQRGRKPKPPQLILVEGTRNVTRHGTEEDLKNRIEQAETAFGPLVKPESFLLKTHIEASKAWDRYIAPAWWLDASREPAAIAYCKLWQEFMKRGSKFPSSKHGQLRAYAAELGLTDERRRPKDDRKDKDDLLDR